MVYDDFDLFFVIGVEGTILGSNISYVSYAFIMEFLRNLGIEGKNYGTSTGQKFWGTDSGEMISSTTPIDGSHITDTTVTTQKEYEEVVEKAQEAFTQGKNPFCASL